MFEEKEKQTVKHIEDFYLLIGVCKPFQKPPVQTRMRLKICGEIKTLIRPDRPDRWTDQIRHIDMYQTGRDNAHVRVLSDPCGEEGDRQVNGCFQKARLLPCA